MHGRVDLIDGAPEPLHAEVAVNMTQTIKEALGSAESTLTEGLVVNAIRKTIDNGQVAFLKSGKLQPVHMNSRYYSFVTQRIQFPTQSEQAALDLIKRRVFWLGRTDPTEIAHPLDVQYLNVPEEKMLALAAGLASQGFIKLDGKFASAAEPLLREEAAIRAAAHAGVQAGIAATRVSA